MPNSRTSHPAVTLSVRVSSKVRNQLEELADATGRTKSFLAGEAIDHYVQTQAWQITAIEKAVKKADSKKAKFVEHEVVTHWLSSWGSKGK